jgi:uncharacterized protein
MLIQLTIENFCSFRDEVTFSMVGVNSDHQHADRIVPDGAGKGKTVLPIAAIYGANAAGKSNLIEAVSFAKELIEEGTRSSSSIAISTFKLGDYREKASKFEFIFTHDGTQYSYGFRLDREQILEEWLYGIPVGKIKEVMFFERSTSEARKTTVEFGPKLTGKGTKRKQFLEFVAEGTRPNQLFLTEAIDRNVLELLPVIGWFKNSLVIIPAEANYLGLEIQILKDEFFTNFLSKFLATAGTGINRVCATEVELDFDQHLSNMSKNDIRDLSQELSEMERGHITLINIEGDIYLVKKDDGGVLKLIQLTTQHQDDNGHLTSFGIEEESEGTQRLIHLTPILPILASDPEKVIFLDELDRRLHPLLSRLFIETVIKIKSQNSQLIFTTHDTNLLDLELLRRDEIWFVEKDLQGSSKLYSLAEFKIRPDLKMEKGYLNGRFGAIPFFGNLESLGWYNSTQDLATESHG